MGNPKLAWLPVTIPAARVHLFCLCIRGHTLGLLSFAVETSAAFGIGGSTNIYAVIPILAGLGQAKLLLMLVRTKDLLTKFHLCP